MKSLYQISSEYLQLAEALTNDELTVESESQLQINQQELQAKGLAYGYLIKEFEYDIDTIDSEIARLEALKTSRKNALDRLKTTLKGAMELYGILELKSPTLKVNFRKSESVIIQDMSQLDSRFIRVKTTKEPDKTAIKQAIKEGQSVQGAELVINNNLQIK
jgi:NDP-sugar pyrophosphorylase family protein